MINLTEGLEQRALFNIMHTNACVLHADAQLRKLVIFIFQRGAYDNATFAGKLNRIACEVGQDLFNALSITHQCARSITVHEAE